MNSSSLLSLESSLGRRNFLRRFGRAAALAGAGSAFYSLPGAFAEELVRTPKQTEGPFYPDHLPLDTDNDLLVINDALTPAVGEITYVSGRILSLPASRSAMRLWRSGSAIKTARTFTAKPEMRTSGIRTSRDSAGSSPAPAANIFFARSNPCRIPGAARTSTTQ
jgi:hypothetical protein